MGGIFPAVRITPAGAAGVTGKGASASKGARKGVPMPSRRNAALTLFTAPGHDGGIATPPFSAILGASGGRNGVCAGPRGDGRASDLGGTPFAIEGSRAGLCSGAVLRGVAAPVAAERNPTVRTHPDGEEEPDMNDRFRPWLLVALILATVGGIHLLTLRSGHDWGGDFSMYVHHAKNLVEGRPYAQTGYLYNPAYATIGPPTYPPGFPLILAPVYLVCGLNFEAMKLVMVASLVVFLLFVFLTFRRELPLGHALAIVVLVGLSRTLLGGANSIGSDMPFMAILYLTLFLLQRAYDTWRHQRPRLVYLVPAVVLMCVAFGTRTLGALVVPSVLA